MELNILISTIDQGIQGIGNILLPYRQDVKYFVSHQYRNEKFLSIPKELLREDVIISQIPGKGLTKSRNNAIRIATGDICVIADDDVTYTNEYFDTILSTYKKNDVDVACFKICKQEGTDDYKYYPKQIITINRIQEHSVSSIEITFRLQSVKQKKVFFDERFGMGSWLNGGGEVLFIHDCIQEGLQVKFYPQYIVMHPHDCTIKSFSKYHERRVRVLGAMDMRLHGGIAFLKAFPRTLKFLPDLLKNHKNPVAYFWETLEGVTYIYKNKVRNK